MNSLSDGHTTDFKSKLNSIQIKHESVTDAKKSDSIGKKISVKVIMLDIDENTFWKQLHQNLVDKKTVIGIHATLFDTNFIEPPTFLII